MRASQQVPESTRIMRSMLLEPVPAPGSGFGGGRLVGKASGAPDTGWRTRRRSARPACVAAPLAWFVAAGLCACTAPAPEPLDISIPAGDGGLISKALPGRVVPPYAFDVAEEAGVDRRCLVSVIAAELLTRNGNPAILVGIDGVQGAAYLSFTESQLGIYESKGLSLPGRGTIAVGSVSRAGEVRLVEADEVEIGQGRMHGVRGISLGEAHETVAGRRPIAVIGYDMLSKYDMLLDMPRQRVMLFRPADGPGCPSLSAWVVGAHRVPLYEDRIGQQNSVVARLDGHAVDMALEPAADMPIITQDDAESAGYATGDASQDDPVRTMAGSIMLGLRHRFGSISIGGWHGHGFDTTIEPARYSLLGLSFFRHRRVLIAMGDGELFFSDEHPDLLPVDRTRAEAGPISSRVAIVHVREGVQ